MLTMSSETLIYSSIQLDSAKELGVYFREKLSAAAFSAATFENLLVLIFVPWFIM